MPLALAAAICLIGTGPAHAALGGAYATVETDRVHMAAQLRSTANGTYTVHAMTMANGEVVNEFTNGDGTVFAVSWHGAGRPDLSQLLGDRFATLQSDNATQGRRRRTPLTVDRTDFVVRSGGHSGAFWGLAYLPRLAPAGFSTSPLP
jgi:hypothetical protein